jgi:hypothetical protein
MAGCRDVRMTGMGDGGRIAQTENDLGKQVDRGSGIVRRAVTDARACFFIHVPIRTTPGS